MSSVEVRVARRDDLEEGAGGAGLEGRYIERMAEVADEGDVLDQSAVDLVDGHSRRCRARVEKLGRFTVAVSQLFVARSGEMPGHEDVDAPVGRRRPPAGPIMQLLGAVVDDIDGVVAGPRLDPDVARVASAGS